LLFCLRQENSIDSGVIPIRTYCIIVNPISGNARHLPGLMELIRRRMEHASDIRYEIHRTEAAGHGYSLALQAVKNGTDIVVSVGGDGTMNEIASALIGSETALALLPRGSGNGFARSLRISMKPEPAMDILLNPQIISVDVGRINQNYFFGVAGIGLDAEIGHSFQHFGKRGPLPYFYIGVKEYFKYSYEEFEMNMNGQTEKIRPLLITIANTPQYGNGAIIAPGADNQDGLLDVCILQKTSALKIVPKLDRLFTGQIDTLPFYSRFLTKEILIRRENDFGYFHTDGEPHMGSRELNVSILEKKMKVCVPSD